MVGVKKRALSPVIATVLLVSVSLVLAVVIFLWARSFVPEAIDKGGQSVEFACEQVNFKIEAYGGDLIVQNSGSIPIYGVEMRVSGSGEIKEVSETPGGGTIANGQTASFNLPSEVGIGDTLIVTPILLGETTKDRVPYICDAEYGRETVIGA